MRVIAGRLGGRRIYAPPGKEVRPTTGRVKEALFSMILGIIPGSQGLDLFAGSGAIGIEALSRGAKQVTFVEKSRRVARVVEKNLIALGLTNEATLWIDDANRAIYRLKRAEPLDWIFADPPYREGWPQRLIGPLQPLLRIGAQLIIEHDPKEQLTPPDLLILIDQRSYGDTMLSRYRRVPEPAGAGEDHDR